MCKSEDVTKYAIIKIPSDIVMHYGVGLRAAHSRSVEATPPITAPLHCATTPSKVFKAAVQYSEAAHASGRRYSSSNSFHRCVSTHELHLTHRLKTWQFLETREEGKPIFGPLSLWERRQMPR